MATPHHALRLTAPTASPEEAAAIVAALERFMRTSASPAGQPAETPDGWRQAAVLEGVSRDPGVPLTEPWLQAPG
ncbi:MAG TPA: hypothetical protein VI296_07215 [Candidatus Dormibacteraeota bacterium]|jgi:hypothetical protein